MLADLEAWQGKRAAGSDHIAAQRKAVGTDDSLAVDRRNRGGPHSGGGRASCCATSCRASRSCGRRRSRQFRWRFLPFRNASGIPLDWLGSNLADMLSTDVGQSAHLRTCQSRPPAPDIAPICESSPHGSWIRRRFRRVGGFEQRRHRGLGAVREVRRSDPHRCDVCRDIKNGRTTHAEGERPVKKRFPAAIDRLGRFDPPETGAVSDVLKELKAQSFQASSTRSVDALRDYTKAWSFIAGGKNAGGAKAVEAATRAGRPIRPGIFASWRRRQSAWVMTMTAEESSRKAVELSQNLPARRTVSDPRRSGRRSPKNYPEAIEATRTWQRRRPRTWTCKSTLARVCTRNLATSTRPGSMYQKLVSAARSEGSIDATAGPWGALR